MFCSIVLLFALQKSLAQYKDYWQQRVKYVMAIEMDVKSNRLNGIQKLEYWNNSPDTLQKLYYHLYWNAFKPGSMMDLAGVKRAGGKWINEFTPEEIGFQKVKWVRLNGIKQRIKEQETILEVILSNPILPGSKVTLELVFEAQVPLAVDRAGRNNMNGVRYAMGQWYPKVCEYDRNGWHADPFVGNGEFYGVWGDFDVKITIDKSYVLGGTGYLQNAKEIGYGYEKPGEKIKRTAGDQLTWHFKAPNVHDFMWAADPDYKHIVRQIPNGPTIHVLYNEDSVDYDRNRFKKGFSGIQDYWDIHAARWTEIADAAISVYPFIKNKFGPYLYEQFSFIQGGVGSMEYAMGTLISTSSPDRAFHEWMHSWYQGILATNELEHPWMDEGFTSYATNLVYDHYLYDILKGDFSKSANFKGSALKPASNVNLAHARYCHENKYKSYFLGIKNKEEPLSTWSDHYKGFGNYISASYTKGSVFLEQLGYITGADIRDKILLEYYRQWQFKHPNPDDFIRVAEDLSGMQLRWYKMYWINTTKTIDYGIDSVWEENGKTRIRLRNVGQVPMPIDLVVVSQDGSKELLYIPMYLMFGEKPVEDKSIPRKTFEAWKFTHPTYTVEIDKSLSSVKGMEIDPSQRMADVDRLNNKWKNTNL